MLFPFEMCGCTLVEKTPGEKKPLVKATGLHTSPSEL